MFKKYRKNLKIFKLNTFYLTIKNFWITIEQIFMNFKCAQNSKYFRLYYLKKIKSFKLCSSQIHINFVKVN
jgi:hypothetical protein